MNFKSSLSLKRTAKILILFQPFLSVFNRHPSPNDHIKQMDLAGNFQNQKLLCFRHAVIFMTYMLSERKEKKREEEGSKGEEKGKKRERKRKVER